MTRAMSSTAMKPISVPFMRVFRAGIAESNKHAMSGIPRSADLLPVAAAVGRFRAGRGPLHAAAAPSPTATGASGHPRAQPGTSAGAAHGRSHSRRTAGRGQPSQPP